MTEIALIGKKIGMTREFYKTGQSVPVTVVKMAQRNVSMSLKDLKTTNNVIKHVKIKKKIIKFSVMLHIRSRRSRSEETYHVKKQKNARVSPLFWKSWQII